MQVILLKNSRLGKKYEVKELAPGLVRNVLLPRGEVALATPENLKQAIAWKANQVAVAENEEAVAAAWAQKLAGLTVEIKAKAGPEGQLFSKIGAKEVADALTKLNITLDDKMINLPKPIKHVGLHQAKGRLLGGREALFTVLVTAV